MTTIIVPETDPVRLSLSINYGDKAWQMRIHKTFDELDNFFVKYKFESKISFGFQHEADNEVSRQHTHLYFFDLVKTKQTLSEVIGKRFGKGNGNFSVSQTCGKDKRRLDIIGAWIYGTTEYLYEPKFTWGLTDEQIAYLKERAAAFWADVERAKAQKNTVVQLVEVVVEKEKQDNVFRKYLEKMWNTPETISWTQARFKKWIIADYLSQCKPCPRALDLNRYAYSLWMLRDKNRGNIGIDEVDLQLYEMR